MKDTLSNVVSTSHHIVSIHGDKVYKRPRNNTPVALEEIAQDYLYLSLIGYDVRMEDDILVMPFIGTPLDSIAPDMGPILQAIEKAQQSLPLPASEKKIGSLVSSITKQKIRERLKGNDFQLKERTSKAMKTAKKILNKRTPRVISHTDTHSKNFLKDKNGVIHLIDWESSIAGLKEFDLAVLHVYLIQEVAKGVIPQSTADEIYENQLKPLIEDQEAYDAFMVFKLVRHLSWAYLELENDAFADAREEVVEMLVKMINDLMVPYQKN